MKNLECRMKNTPSETALSYAGMQPITSYANPLRKVLLLASLVVLPLLGFAQQYTGMSGLIHVPSADMDKAGVARVGAHFLNREFTPDGGFNYGGKYHTMSHYLSITPFSWLEIGYTCTFQKGKAIDDLTGQVMEGKAKYRFKDRYFSLKLQPLKEREGKWWPSLAVGTNDPYGTDGNNGTGKEEVKPSKGDGKSQYFANFYVAASKHFDLKGNALGVHLAYRHWKRSYNDKWNGPVGGITFQPSFQKNLRLIAEYTGDDVNIGFDWKLWKFLLLQSSLQNGKYFSGGLCFCINLL